MELAGSEHEAPRVGHRLDRGARALRALLIAPSRQWREALGFEHLAHRGGAQWLTTLLQALADLIDGIVALAQLNDQIARGGLLRLLAWAALGGDEEERIGLAAEVVAEHLEGPGAVAEGAGDLPRGALFDEVGPQGLVLAVPGRGGLEEKALAIS